MRANLDKILSLAEMKAAETRQAITAGATEIDTGANRLSARAGISILNEVKSL